LFYIPVNADSNDWRVKFVEALCSQGEAAEQLVARVQVVLVARSVLINSEKVINPAIK
jgi:hypothetical protein